MIHESWIFEVKYHYNKVWNDCFELVNIIGKKWKGKTPRTHRVMGLNTWEVVTPKMGNPGDNFGLVSSQMGPDTKGFKQKKKNRVDYHYFVRSQSIFQ